MPRTPPLNHTETSSESRPHPDDPGTGRPGPLQRPSWTLLTNHAHVLLAVAHSPDARVAEIAAQVGITTRATLTILKELEAAGYLTRHRIGRRTHYTVDRNQHFRHPATAAHEVGELLAIFTPDPPSSAVADPPGTTADQH